MSILRRNNVTVRGTGERVIVFAHGFGSDQSSWRYLQQSFERSFVTVTLDHVGSGNSQLAAYSSKYGSLAAYADDLVEIGLDLDLSNAVLVGHSCGAMIGALAWRRKPELFSQLIMIAPSARYIDDGEYRGGFSEAQAKEAIALIEADHRSWASLMIPLMIGHPDQPGLTESVIDDLQKLDSTVAGEMARAVLFSDWRSEMSLVTVPTLILQCKGDWVAPQSAGADLHNRIKSSTMRLLEYRGHFPHLVSPRETISAIMTFLQAPPRLAARGVPRPWSKGRAKAVRIASEILSSSKDRDSFVATDAQEGSDLLDSLLSRTGELWLHLGRYDMYARSIQEWLTPNLGAGGERFNLSTRGMDILRKLSLFDADLAIQFSAIDADMHDLVSRHEIAASRGAHIPGLNALPPGTSARSAPEARDWFDQTVSGACLYRQRLEVIERDILRTVALCFRICSCAMRVGRLVAKVPDVSTIGLESETLYSLGYVSSAATPMSHTQLQNLLKISRSNNDATLITGMLLYKDDSFMQVLEGREAEIRILYDQISSDSRHQNLTILFKGPILKRAFEGWSMGFKNLRDAPYAGPCELENLVFTDKAFTEDPAKARSLLLSFYH